MSRRHNHIDERARRGRYAAALDRPELRGPRDPFGRAPAASPTSAPVRVQDPATTTLIEDFMRRRNQETRT